MMKETSDSATSPHNTHQPTITQSRWVGEGTGPLVTVVIPTVRRPDYLREALRSVVEQTYRNLQIIVSDNGSGDATPDVVSQFKDDRILFRQNAVTIAPYDHFQQYLSCAEGTYFMLLCDDDKISPDYIEGMVEAMERWPEATAAFGSSCTMDQQGVIQQSCILNKMWCEPGIGFLMDWFLGRRRFPTWSVISVFTRTSLTRQYGGPPAFLNFSDVAYVVTLALAGPTAFSDKGCFYYRVHASGDCVNMPWADRTESVRAFNRYLTSDPLRELTNALPHRELRAMQYAINHALACSCLSQFYQHHIYKMTFIQVTKALLEYPINMAYLLCLPRLAYWKIRNRGWFGSNE